MGALILLHNQLRNISYVDIINSVKAIPSIRIFIALCLSLSYYFILGGYDIIAFKFINAEVPIKIKDVLFTCFISNVLANNTGYSMLFGGSIRYRLYSLHNVSIVDITKVLLFSSATIWLGLLAIGGFIFTFAPVPLGQILNLNISTKIIGLIFIFLLAVYVLLSRFHSKPYKIFKWKISFPDIRIVTAQVLLATSDWLIASLTLFVLMPEGYVSYFVLLKVFLVSQFFVIVSQVPGGMGVFETSITLLMPNSADNPGVVSALLVYRVVFYFFPLLIALCMLGTFEIMVFTKKFSKSLKIFGKTVSSLIVQVVALFSFFSGMIAIFSASAPFNATQLKAIASLLPSWIADISHFLLSITAVALLFISRALQIRIKKAWSISCFLAAFAVVLIIIIGEPVLILLCFVSLLISLLFSRKYFYRDIPILKTNFSPLWFYAVGGVFALSVWIGFFVNRQNISSWTCFDVLFASLLSTSDAARFLRASFGTGTIIVILIFEQIFKNFSREPVVFTKKDIAAIARSSNYAYALEALVSDKEFILNNEKDAFIMYAKSKSSWIALGDPVGRNFRRNELLWKFKEIADAACAKPAFVGIDGKYMQIYDDVGLDIFKIGQEAKILLKNFDVYSEKFEYFHDLENKIQNAGFVYKSLSADMFNRYKNEFSNINEQWMEDNCYFNLKFLPGRYNVMYMQHMDFSVLERDGRVYAFSIFLKTDNKHEISSGIVRYLKSGYDLFSYLIFKNTAYAKSAGYKWFDLGLAYFEQRDNTADSAKYFAKMFMFAEHFNYDSVSLRNFKEKFLPVWQSKYVAVHPDKYITSFIKNFAALVSPEETGDRNNFFKRFFKQ
ncbi:MAG: phosphatidylglycerol lysyltransferase domain-containing protein [Endomicrobium sp.]|nr:phosphatidylglycerol lysyltransferase domain-containing protein [Endomicrobium sp.]